MTWDSLLVHVEARTRIGLGPDLIFFTGDLTWDGSRRSFELCKKKIQRLLTVARLERDAVFVVPGNHDVLQGSVPPKRFRPAIGAALHASLSRAKRGAPDAARDAARRESFAVLAPEAPGTCPMLSGYSAFARAVMPHVKQVSPAALTWYAVSDREPRVAILGMNTAWAACRSELEADGALPCGSRLVAEAVKCIRTIHPDVKLCLLLGHHPARALYDFPEVVGSMADLPVVYLRGHLHRASFRLEEDQHGIVLEVAAGAVHSDLFSEEAPPHRITWGSFAGNTLEFESRIQHRSCPEEWVLDTSAFPTREADDYRLRIRVVQDMTRLSPSRRKPVEPHAQLDFVGVGLAAVSTIACLASDPGEHPDNKADADALWEPELGTFAPFVASLLAKLGRRVGLVTSMAEDRLGRDLRGLLLRHEIELLFCRSTDETGRQLALTPRQGDRRWNIDRQIDRRPPTVREQGTLADVLKRIVAARWIAFDKYELDLMRCILASPSWREKRRPWVMFETGSRPLKFTKARTGGVSTRSVVELEHDIVRAVDLFTTTKEWLASVAGESAPTAEALEWPQTARVLRIGPESQRPRAVLVSMGSAGSRIITPGFATTVAVESDVASLTVDRRGAGDVLRAAIIARLLQEDDDRHVEEILLDPTTAVALVSMAQAVVRCWLTRSNTTDYFGDFIPTAARVISGGF